MMSPGGHPALEFREDGSILTRRGARSGVGCVMDRAMQLRHLEEAERHVAQGERHIAAQERRIADMRSAGLNTGEAIDLLKTFRELQAQHLAHRDHILSELEL
ncbi:hypothetical protein AXW67_33205 [Bradyrhizobium neotropicale]|uniref:Uncharacterized protein n=1 Tax=Bradyrhizobium neotropicale TaxID=1497615 RepID=A0A176YHI0_9BRAD|nr:hypothetical protein AXW67_33205 [Bradyrhizobium neotropicale]